MVGVSRALFVPLALAVGLAMLASYLLSNTLVPALSVWLLREQARQEAEEAFFHRWQRKYGRIRIGGAFGVVAQDTAGKVAYPGKACRWRRLAKAARRVVERGASPSQSTNRARLSATAVQTFCSCVFASPAHRARRGPGDPQSSLQSRDDQSGARLRRSKGCGAPKASGAASVSGIQSGFALIQSQPLSKETDQ